jgi:hypothetical protein
MSEKTALRVQLCKKNSGQGSRFICGFLYLDFAHGMRVQVTSGLPREKVAGTGIRIVAFIYTGKATP